MLCLLTVGKELTSDSIMLHCCLSFVCDPVTHCVSEPVCVASVGQLLWCKLLPGVVLATPLSSALQLSYVSTRAKAPYGSPAGAEPAAEAETGVAAVLAGDDHQVVVFARGYLLHAEPVRHSETHIAGAAAQMSASHTGGAKALSVGTSTIEQDRRLPDAPLPRCLIPGNAFRIADQTVCQAPRGNSGPKLASRSATTAGHSVHSLLLPGKSECIRICHELAAHKQVEALRVWRLLHVLPCSFCAAI